VGIAIGPPLAAALVVALGPAAAVGAAAQLGTSWRTVAAGLRAVVQLAAVALLIGAIVGSVWWSALFVAVVVVVAARTALHPSGWWAA
jgi:putative ABC transport system permease protein